MKEIKKEKYMFIIFSLVSLLVVLPIILILLYIFFQGFRALNLSFLLSFPSRGGREGGILPPLVGTFLLILFTLLMSLPLGVLAGIFMSEYATKKFSTEVIKVAIWNLAGVPSVVYGLFGLSLFVIALRLGSSILSGALTLGVLTLPIIISATEEALKSVPSDFKEGSLALGATRWQTIRNISLPYALPGILTGVILSMGRIAGETAPIIFTVAAFYLPRLPSSPFDQSMVLSYHIFVTATQVHDIRTEMVFGSVLVLLLVVLLFYTLAMYFRNVLRKKRWG